MTEQEPRSVPGGMEGEKKQIEGIQRTEGETALLRERLSFIARICSENYGVKLIPSATWAAGLSPERARLEKKGLSLEKMDERFLKPDILSYKENDLLGKREGYCLAVLRHEIGHLKYTDFKLLTQGMESAKEEGYSPADWQLLLNAVEDPRVNLQETKGSRRAKERLATIYQEDMPPFVAKLRELPAPVQFGGLIVGKWAQAWARVSPEEDLTQGLNQRTVEVYRKTEEAVKRATESESAEESFQIIREEIWPEYKKLIDQYLEEQARVEFDKEQEEKKKAGEESEEREYDDLENEGKTPYQNKAREKLKEAEDEFNQEFGAKTMEIEEKEGGEVETKPKEVDPEDINKAGRVEEERREREAKRRAEERRREREEQGKRTQALTRLRERKEGLTEGERRLYEEYRKAVAPQIRELKREIDKTFPPKEEIAWVSGKPRGQRIERKRLAREVATRHGQMFRKKEISQVREAAFTLLVDVSGSMRGEKIQAALRSAIMMAEVLTDKGLFCEILVFHSQTLELKKFEQDYKGPEKRKLIGMLKEAESTYAGATDQGFAVDWAADRLQKECQRLKSGGALVVITDGQPEPVEEHSGPEWELKGVVEKWQKRLPVIGLGIGPAMAEIINHYYGRSAVAEPDIRRQPQALLRILKNELSRMKKVR